MSRLLWLTFSPNVNWNALGQLRRHARDHGIELRTLDTAEVAAEIAGADGLLLTSNQAVTSEVRDRILRYVEAGGRLLVVRNDPSLNDLLGHYDIQVTNEKLVATEPSCGHPQVFELRRENQPFPAEARLLDGVESVHLSHPRLVRYQGRAAPLLTAGSVRYVNAETDWPTDLGIRIPCCGALWPTEEYANPRVVVIGSDGLLRDDYHGPFGDVFPGFDTNEAFMRNVFLWLLHSPRKDGAVGDDSIGSVAAMTYAIEMNVYEYVTRKLQSAYRDEWWTRGVPKNIRKSAAERQEEEDGRSPREAYLYLIDLRSIVEANWTIFQADLAEDPKGSKSQNTSWLQTFNEIRNRVSHPVKLKHMPLSEEDRAFLVSRLSFSENLIRRPPPLDNPD